jgi:putative PEP-CTERM system TPR-repeat lipoprotein
VEKDYAAARGYYNELLQQRPDYLVAQLKLAELDAMEGDVPGMIAKLERAMEVHASALEPRIILARYYLASKNPQRVAVLFSDLEPEQQDVPAVLNLLALSQLAQKDYAGAKYTLEKLTQSGSDSAQLHHQLAMAEAGLNEPEALRQELEKAIELSPDYLPSRLALSRLLLSQRKTDEAKPHLEKLRELAPEYPDVLQLEAAAARLEGDQDKALKFTRLAYEKLPNTKNVLSYSSQVRVMGEPEKAQALLEQWLEGNPDDVLVRLSLAEFYAARLERDKSLDQYRAILEIDDVNLVALNNLAWYLQDSEPTQALKYAQRASEVNPDSADVLDTLALAQLKTGNARKAQRSIRRALEIQPDHPTMRYHSALIAVAIEDKSAARQVLGSLLDSGVDFPEKSAAEKLFREL